MVVAKGPLGGLAVAGTRIGYITDNEFLRGYLGPPGDITPFSKEVQPYRRIVEFVAGVDVLISEAQYPNDEYVKKVGWGHSSVTNACVLLKLAGIKRWIVTHHDPMHDDDFLLRKLNLTRQVLASINHHAEVTNAFDSMTGYF